MSEEKPRLLREQPKLDEQCGLVYDFLEEVLPEAPAELPQLRGFAVFTSRKIAICTTPEISKISASRNTTRVFSNFETLAARTDFSENSEKTRENTYHSLWLAGQNLTTATVEREQSHTDNLSPRHVRIDDHISDHKFSVNTEDDAMHNSAIDQFFAQDVARLTETFGRISQSVPPDANPDNPQILGELTDAIDFCARACLDLQQALGDDTALLRATQTRFRETIQPWFSQSWFMRQALTKPRGYAGDYEILTRLYDGLPVTLGFGGYLDRHFLLSELGTSVPLRLQMVREFLIEEARQRREMSVLNIACGPCREYAVDWELPADCQVKVVCADADALALDYVRTQVVPKLPSTIDMTLMQHNALKAGNTALNLKLFGRRDVIYSVGLFDYIPDRLLVRMLAGLRESLAPNGVIYLAFKDSDFYDAMPYQWFVDWYFYQRTEAECRALLQAAGYDVQTISLTRDATGSIINYISRNTAVVTATQESSSEIPVPAE